MGYVKKKRWIWKGSLKRDDKKAWILSLGSQTDLSNIGHQYI